jgi:hypothetical protein
MKTDGYMPVGRSAVSLPRDLAVQMAVQWLRRLAAGRISRDGLNTCLNMGFVVGKVAMGQVFL